MRLLSTAIIPSLWAALVVAGAWRRRPAPSRVLDLVGSSPSPPGSMSMSAPGRPSAVGRLGALIRRAAGQVPEPVTDRRAGWAAVATFAVLFVSPLAGAGVLVLSCWWVGAAGRRRRQRERASVDASVPETIDLFVLAAGAGHPVRRSLEMVAARAGGPVGRELRRAMGRIRRGERTGDALEAVARTLGDPVRPLVGVLCASERYGTPLVSALELLAVEARNDRRRRAEIAARRVPVKLLFPLVLCTLPAFALLTVVPLLIGAFGSLRL